jgi:hypothetical protein
MLDLFNAYRADAQHIVSALLALAIWRWGAAPERWLIGTFVATMVLPIYAFNFFDLGAPAIGPFAWAFVIIDLFAAAAFLGIALNANRNYPLWIAGFQLVAMGAHMVRGLVDSVSPLAYAMLAIGPSYFQLLLILSGFVRHLHRKRRFGPYREWRVTTPRDGMLKL